jgi:hypothetical protein
MSRSETGQAGRFQILFVGFEGYQCVAEAKVWKPVFSPHLRRPVQRFQYLAIIFRLISTLCGGAMTPVCRIRVIPVSSFDLALERTKRMFAAAFSPRPTNRIVGDRRSVNVLFRKFLSTGRRRARPSGRRF